MRGVSRRVPADSFAQRTRAILIGANRYVNLKCLDSPVPDVTALASALQNMDAWALPDANVKVSSNKDVTSKKSLLAFLSSSLEGLGADDLLFLYFAGHGIKQSGETFLCPSEADPKNLFDTAISGADLETLLSSVQPRALLVVVDCCEGAGFVENAPRLFRQLGDSDFRILISSSRVGQSSWELPDGGGTLFARHFRDALNGTVSVGEAPGIITFSGLFKYLALQIAHDLRTKYDNLPRQEPIFTGTYHLDPVVFVHKGLTFAQVSVRVAWYPKDYITKVVLRAFWTVCFSLLFIIGCALNYWEHSEFVEQNGEGNIEIMKGHPWLKRLRAPQPLWVFNFGSEAVRPESQLRRGTALIAPLDRPVLPLLGKELIPEFRAKLFLWNGEMKDARSEIRTIITKEEGGREVIKSPGRESQAVDLFAEVATAEDELDFQRLLIGSIRKDVKVAAVKGRIRLDPDTGAPHLNFDYDPDTSFFPSLLQEFARPCHPKLAMWLSMLLNASKYASQQETILDNALRLGCRLDTPVLVKAIEHASVWLIQDVAYYISTEHLDGFGPILISELALHRHEPQITARLLLALSYIDPTTCHASVQNFLRDPNTDVRQAAALVLLGGCKDRFTKPVLAMPRDLNLLLVLVKHHLIGAEGIEQALRNPLNTLQEWKIEKLFHAIQYVNSADLDETVKDLIIESGKMSIKADGVSLLRKRGAPSDPAQGLFSAGGTEVQEEAYRWYLAQHRQEGFHLLLALLQDPSRTFVTCMVATLTLSDVELSQVRLLLSSHSIAKRRAVAILTMKASPREVQTLLQHEDQEIRETAYEYVGYREDMRTIIANLNSSTRTFPDSGTALVRKQQTAREGLLAELQMANPERVQWRLRMYLRTHTSPMDRGVGCSLMQRLEGLWSPDESLDTPKELIITEKFNLSNGQFKKMSHSQ